MTDFVHRARVALAAVPFVLLLVLVGVLMAANPLYDSRTFRNIPAVAGVADLSANPAGINGVQGDWLFWWERFVVDPASVPADGFGSLPGSWKAAGVHTPYGYASWALRLRGLDPRKTYAIRFGQTLSACRIIANGTEIGAIGRPGVSPAAEKPYWDSVYPRFSPRADGTADIVLQVSNWQDRSGGSNASIYVGEVALMYRMADSLRQVDAFIFSVLGVLGLFFFVLYMYRRAEARFLWFAGINLVVAVRTLCYDSFVLLDFARALPWQAFVRLGYLTFPLIVILFAGFVWRCYPDLFSRKAFALIAASLGSYAVIIVVAPLRLVFLLLIPYQILTLFFFPYTVAAIVRACVRRIPGASWVLAGLSAALAIFFYDILVSMWIIPGFSFSQLGMCFCLFCLALMVIERYTASFESVRRLTRELHVVNRALKRFVPAELLDCLNKKSIVDIRPGDCVERNMAVLSADIRSFTSLAEKMSPDGVFAFLNSYLELVGPIIRANGGFIAKYEGDGFMALFPGGAEAAVTCAVQMQSAIGSWNRNTVGRKPIAVGIGIDSGKMALGTIGDDFRIDGTVVSSCVRGASWLESSTKTYLSRIMISGSVLSGLSDPLAWFIRPVDRLESADRNMFVFEVYNNDPNHVRNLKWKSQSDLEHTLYAWFAGKTEESRGYLVKALLVFPDDPVAKYYAQRIGL